jgi:DNA end-binding protein Ku
MPSPGTGILSFGLVAIPVRIHTATKSENVSFHLLHKKCRRAYAISIFARCATWRLSGKISSAASSTRKDQYVPITEEELESLEADANKSIDLKEFIPLASVDPVYFENTHYLSADKGGERPYRLLADAMAKSGRVVIAELVSRGKEQLVLIRPHKKGLVLHTMYYADEVRDFNQLPKGEKVNVSKQELELGVGHRQAHIRRVSPGELQRRVPHPRARHADEKSKGKEVVIDTAPAPKRGQVIDINGSPQAQHGKNAGEEEARD